MSYSIMLQGTASSVGKSLLATALCRIFTQDGYETAPFKSQNMSNNSYITPEGLEMGRAQVMQAEACGKMPQVDMNPVLLKPTSEKGSQVIVQGRPTQYARFGNMSATEYYDFKTALKEPIMESYHRLEKENDIIVLEGAGSCAEINLKANDIVNMGMAEMADAPVLLVGDIDLGGVFASLYGCVELQEPQERARIKGLIINKFRGDIRLLEPGLKMIEDLVHIPVLGVVPYTYLNLEDEDSVTKWHKFERTDGDLTIGVIRLPYISNFTDINPFRMHKDINLRIVRNPNQLAGVDMILIPGSKSVMHDLKWLKKQGLDQAIREAHQKGVAVFGICGGYQMLGKRILDPEHAESEISECEGLGLIPRETVFSSEKHQTLSEGSAFGEKVRGYEIHMGETAGPGEPLIYGEKANDGYSDPIGQVYGTYYHGIFDNAAFTRTLLNHIRSAQGKAPIAVVPENYWEAKERELDQLADTVRNSLDMDAIYEIMGVKRP